MEIKASEGMWLTQVKDVAIQDRVCTKLVYTAAKNVSKWYEITDEIKSQYDEEYAEWLREQEQRVGTDDGLGY